MRGAGWLVGSFLFLSSAGAVAAPTSAEGEARERDDLTRQLAQDYAALSTSDCAVACRALGSMQRAADRICVLSPGPACDDARGKVDDARRRVREACPMCAAERPRLESPAPLPAPVVQASAAPPAERARGGCAGCATTDADAGSLRGAGALLLLLLVSRRRSRRAIVRDR